MLLNDEMDDFTAKVGSKNVFGIIGSEPNKIAPGKRPLSSMAPTFLITPDQVAILGTPGGSRIPTMILLSALSFYDGKGPISFVSKPRFHHQYRPDVVQYERDAFDKPLIEGLKKMGYQLQMIDYTYGGFSDTYGDMQAVVWDKKADRLQAASDPRHIGLALSYLPSMVTFSD